MFSMIILLVAVLAPNPSLGAKIPDNNVKSTDTVGSLPPIMFESKVQNSTSAYTDMMTAEPKSDNMTPAPPRKATFIAECHVPSSSNMWGLCWRDETTVLMLDRDNGGRIIKYNIDFQLRSCRYSVWYTNVGEVALGLSCPSNGEIYIIHPRDGLVSIIKGGRIYKWKPYRDTDTEWGMGFAVNDDLIAISGRYMPDNIYTRQGQFMYSLSSEADKSYKFHLIISPSSSHLVASAGNDQYIFIHDLINHETIRAGGSGKEGGKLGWPISTSFDASELYVLVCENSNGRISVFDVKGNFMHVLEMGPGGSDRRINNYLATIHREGKPSLLAVDMTDDNYSRTIKIYSLST